MAMPHAPSPSSSPSEVALPRGACGNAELSCCEDIDETSIVSEEEEASLLKLLSNDVLSNGVLGKYRGCSALASLQGTVGGQCNNHVACCNGGDNEINGLVNVAIPCLPISLL
ncbi:hypothetical protein BDV12DRAFT_176252 [Aspergillus spectabilis]